MRGRGRRWARLGGAAVGVAAALVLSLGADASGASAATTPAGGAQLAASATFGPGTVYPMSVRWQ